MDYNHCRPRSSVSYGAAAGFADLCRLTGCVSPHAQALPEKSVAGPRASVFSPDKDGEVRQRRNIGCIVDGVGCSQAGQLRLPLSDSSCASSI